MYILFIFFKGMDGQKKYKPHLKQDFTNAYDISGTYFVFVYNKNK
jgi:hypothetical protein